MMAAGAAGSSAATYGEPAGGFAANLASQSSLVTVFSPAAEQVASNCSEVITSAPDA